MVGSVGMGSVSQDPFDVVRTSPCAAVPVIVGAARLIAGIGRGSVSVVVVLPPEVVVVPEVVVPVEVGAEVGVVSITGVVVVGRDGLVTVATRPATEPFTRAATLQRCWLAPVVQMVGSAVKLL